MLPITGDYRNGYFFVKENGKRFVTPLLLYCSLLSSTDVVFAVIQYQQSWL
jgi:hypothetical protein